MPPRQNHPFRASTERHFFVGRISRDVCRERMNPRLYVLRLAWLGRRAAAPAVALSPRPDRGRAARARWPRPSFWRYRP